MNATETTDVKATKPARNPFAGLTCPECGSTEGTIRMELGEGFPSCSCGECEWEGTPEEALDTMFAKVAVWERLVRWVNAAPGRPTL